MNNIESDSGKPKVEPQYPADLSATDIALIKSQCEHQDATSIEQLEGFAMAYSEAKKLTLKLEKLNNFTGDDIEALILNWAIIIEKRNKKGYRKVPVTFQNTSTALKPELIERAIQNFSEAYAEGNMNSEEAYTEFEKIHPFEDGNGRIGDLLWKIDVTRKTGKWPETLPPDIFKIEKNEWLEEATKKWKETEWTERQYWLGQVADEYKLPRLQFVMTHKHFGFERIPEKYQKILAQKWGIINNEQNIKYSFLSAAGVFIYVSGISWFFSNAQAIFGKTTEPNFLIPIFMLLLFVISASITGLLVLGKPIHLYLSGHKKEALILLFYTIGWLVLFLVLVIIYINNAENNSSITELKSEMLSPQENNK